MGPFPFPLQKSNNQQGLIAKTMGQRELATTGFAKSPFNNEEEETEGEEEEEKELYSKTNRPCHSVACCLLR